MSAPKTVLAPALTKAKRKALERRRRELRGLLRGPCPDPDTAAELRELDEVLAAE